MMAFHALALTTLFQKGASQGISEGTALIVAAGVGALLAALGTLLAAVLQTLGAFLINFLAARREERAAARETEKRHEQWEREDKLRREEQQRESWQRRQTDRAEAYRKFAAATAFAIPLDEDRRAEQLAKLTETHTEVQAYGSSDVRSEAAELYESAYRALYTDPKGDDSAVRNDLDSIRKPPD
jgi:uncharacterized membrane protein YhiD involved in acid resistance